MSYIQDCAPLHVQGPSSREFQKETIGQESNLQRRGETEDRKQINTCQQLELHGIGALHWGIRGSSGRRIEMFLGAATIDKVSFVSSSEPSSIKQITKT